MSFEHAEEPLPTSENPLSERVGLFSDAAHLLLDTYGKTDISEDGNQVDFCEWSDVMIAADYVLCRFQPIIDVDRSQAKWLLQLEITQNFNNGERSVTRHAVNPLQLNYSTKFVEMTEGQRAERDKRASEIAEHSENRHPTPSSRDIIGPHIEMDFLVDVLRKGLETLEVGK